MMMMMMMIIIIIIIIIIMATPRTETYLFVIKTICDLS